MISNTLYRFTCAAFLLFALFSVTNAQNGEPPPGGDGFAPPPRPNLLQELNLSKEQIQQLRIINREWNPRRQQAQRSFREAQRELEEAIYLDEADEGLINRKKEMVKTAHSELINTQTTMQTLIRNILTNQQLARFKQLRQQFAQRQGDPNGRPVNQNNRPLNQRNNQPSRPLPNRILRPKQRP
jgi:Spy/CpxP family protein refolding chaperone